MKPLLYLFIHIIVMAAALLKQAATGAITVVKDSRFTRNRTDGIMTGHEDRRRQRPGEAQSLTTRRGDQVTVNLNTHLGHTALSPGALGLSGTPSSSALLVSTGLAHARYRSPGSCRDRQTQLCTVRSGNCPSRYWR